MSSPENVDANSGLFGSLRSFWSVLIAILYTRLDLATTELEESGTHAVQLVVISLAALFCVGMTIFFFLCFLVILSGPHLLLVLGIICGLCLVASVALGFIARKMALERPKFLGQTLAELRRDVESLRAKINAGESK